MADEAQAKFSVEYDNLKIIQKQYVKAMSTRQQLGGQLHENTTVKQELDLMKATGEIYKLIGPVLVKQSLDEAKQNVTKRIDYITGELKRLDDAITTLDNKQDEQREKLAKLQSQFKQDASAIKA